MLLLQQHNGRVSVTRLQLRLRTIRPGDASWCECCLKQSSCCPVRSARLFTLSICFLLLLKNPPVWFLPLKCNSFNLLNLFMMKTNRSSDRNTQGHVLSQSFFGESYISPQLPEHFSSDTAASSLCCVLSTVLFCLKHALRSSCGKLKFRAHCSVFMRLCIYPRILLWKFSHSRLAGAGADCLILSHRWPLTSPLSLSRRQSQAPPSWTGESHVCVLPQSRAAPRALGKLFSMFVSSV